MMMPARDGQMAQHHDISARVKFRCQVTDAHVRSMLLDHATIYADGWARWTENSHVIIGYLRQAFAVIPRMSTSCRKAPCGGRG
jgi:hypothetical protein